MLGFCFNTRADTVTVPSPTARYFVLPETSYFSLPLPLHPPPPSPALPLTTESRANFFMMHCSKEITFYAVFHCMVQMTRLTCCICWSSWHHRSRTGRCKAGSAVAPSSWTTSGSAASSRSCPALRASPRTLTWRVCTWV